MEFSALNKESPNSSLSIPPSKKKKLTQEAQESICLKLYHEAMKSQQSGEWNKARELYCEILESEVMEDVCRTTEESFQLSTSTIGRLKFLIYKNLASISREQGDLSAAIDSYIEAVSVDSSDITVWSQLASLSSSLGNLLLARKALEQALVCQPSHWPTIEALCTVLFALQDYPACLHTVSRGLELDDQFPRGLVYLQEIIAEQPELLNYLHLSHLQLHLMKEQPECREMFMKEAMLLHRRRCALNEVVVLQESVVPQKKLSSLTLHSLAGCLSSLCKHCTDLPSKERCLFIPVDFSTFIESSCSAPLPHPTPSCTGSPAGKGSLSSETPGNASLVKPSDSEGGGEEAKVGVVRREARRRLMVEGIDVFAPKRRSSRVLTRRKEKEHKNYFDMLKKFIPTKFMMRELPEIVDLSPIKKAKRHEESLSELKLALAAVASSTPQLAEAEEVTKFVREAETNSGIVQLAFDFIRFLSLRYDHKWCRQPSPLARSFVELFNSIFPHLVFPSPYCSPVESQQAKFQEIAMVILCYVEMFIDTYKPNKSTNQDAAGSTGQGFRKWLSYVQHCSGAVGVGALGKVQFTLRVQWCIGKWNQMCQQQLPAMKAFTMCKDLIQVFYVDEAEGPLLVYLPNVSNGNVISLDHVNERLRALERTMSVSEVKQQFKERKYGQVAERLLPLVDQGTTISSEFLTGVKGHTSDSTSLYFLLESLLSLHCYRDCVEVCVCCCLQLLQHQQLSSDGWAGAIKNVFVALDRCLEEEESCGEVWLGVGGARLVRQLVVCVLRVMDSVYDMADNLDYFYSMPIVLPWKLFHVVIDRGWSNEREGVCGTPSVRLSPIMAGEVVEMSCDSEEPMAIVDQVRNHGQTEQMETELEETEVMSRGEAVRSTPPLSRAIASSPSPLLLSTSTKTCGLEVSEWRSAEMAVGDTRQPLSTSVHGASSSATSSSATATSSSATATSSAATASSSAATASSSAATASSSAATATSSAATATSSTATATSSSATATSSAATATSSSATATSSAATATSSASTTTSPSSVKTPLLGEKQEAIDLLAGGSAPGSIDGSDTSGTPSYLNLVGRAAASSTAVTTPTPRPKTPTAGDKLNSLSSSSVSSPAMDRTSSPSTSCSSIINVDSDDPASLSETLAPPLEFLVEAHRHLGRMGWCCKQNGVFLKHSVQTLRKELNILTRLPGKQREVLMLELEQCYFCLYGHPHNKKARARGLVDHSSEQVKLTWESAQMLIQHYHPLSLPSIDVVKPQLSAEVVALYKKVLDVLPAHGQVLSKESLVNFLAGQSEALVETAPTHQESSIIADIYYILADDALRSMDHMNAVKHYRDTICYSPDRFDSWAGLALAHARSIQDKLDTRDLKSPTEKYVRRHCSEVVVSFKKAISLNKRNINIIEKFGFFCYTMQSHASQILRQPSLFVLSDVHSWARSSHKEMQKQAKECFSMALELGGARNAEPWIYHWMLGKLGRKLKEPAKKVLASLVESAVTLYEDGASYPDQVEVVSKDHSVEAVEVHYQIHSIALKLLLPFHQEVVTSAGTESKRQVVMEAVRGALSSLNNIPLSCQSYCALWQWAGKLIKSCVREKGGSVGVGGCDCVEDGRIAGVEKMEVEVQESAQQLHDLPEAMAGYIGDISKFDYWDLLKLCFYGVSVCAVKFLAFFKPLYRMASTLLELGLPQEAKALLIGPLPEPLVKCQERLQPMFVFKSNIFTNMWQVRKCEEVNRPGTFSTHARRNLELLVRVLVTLCDSKLLLQVSQLLKNKPDSTKQYMRENERLAAHKKVVRECVKALREETMQENLTSSAAVQLKTVAAGVRSMASKLEKKLIEELDSIVEHLQSFITVEEELATNTSTSSILQVTTTAPTCSISTSTSLIISTGSSLTTSTGPSLTSPSPTTSTGPSLTTSIGPSLTTSTGPSLTTSTGPSLLTPSSALTLGIDIKSLVHPSTGISVSSNVPSTDSVLKVLPQETSSSHVPGVPATCSSAVSSGSSQASSVGSIPSLPNWTVVLGKLPPGSPSLSSNSSALLATTSTSENGLFSLQPTTGVPPAPHLEVPPALQLEVSPAPHLEVPPALQLEVSPAPQLEVPAAPQFGVPPAPQFVELDVTSDSQEARIGSASLPVLEMATESRTKRDSISESSPTVWVTSPVTLPAVSSPVYLVSMQPVASSPSPCVVFPPRQSAIVGVQQQQNVAMVPSPSTSRRTASFASSPQPIVVDINTGAPPISNQAAMPVHSPAPPTSHSSTTDHTH